MRSSRLSDGDGDGEAEALGDGDALGDADALGEAEALGDGDALGEGDALLLGDASPGLGLGPAEAPVGASAGAWASSAPAWSPVSCK
ncbi:hypothetical protein [Streptomyces apocyni]|uniref:hypothetical protein n=1 Tax=Streptomyces apocyni TaxID=2654677 RepID=UPI002D7F81A3|nr:hypothetical protein [Streptomyces apocyni]